MKGLYRVACLYSPADIRLSGNKKGRGIAAAFSFRYVMAWAPLYPPAGKPGELAGPEAPATAPADMRWAAGELADTGYTAAAPADTDCTAAAPAVHTGYMHRSARMGWADTADTGNLRPHTERVCP